MVEIKSGTLWLVLLTCLMQDMVRTAHGEEDPVTDPTADLAPAEMADTDSGEVSNTPDTPDPVLAETIRLYSDRILELEIENGAYNTDLTEQLLGLGNALNQAGQHLRAREVLTRALHVQRINHGLQNIDQLPLIEALIETNTALGDFAELSRNYGYLTWVYGRNYGLRDTRMATVYTRTADWHLQAYEQTDPPDSVGHLVMAVNFYSKAIDIIEESGKPDDPALIAPLYGIVDANFKLVQPLQIPDGLDTRVYANPAPLLPTQFDSEYDLRRRQDDFYRYNALTFSRESLSRMIEDRNNMTMLVQNSYRSGRDSLLRIIALHDANPELPLTSKALAITYLGDWALRFNRRDQAIAHYAEAYALLSDSSEYAEALAQLFGHPHSLGRFSIPDENGELPPRILESLDLSGVSDEELSEITDEKFKDSQFVLVEFDVSHYGTVRGLEVLAANPPDNVRFRRMARDDVQATPFRPRMEEGKPVATENVRMLYRYE